VRKLAAGIEEKQEAVTLNRTVLIASDGSIWQRMKSEYGQRMEHRYVPDSKYPQRHEILVTKTELERFESQFSEEGQAPANVAAVDISSKERASLQKQIAALAIVLSEKLAGKYKNGDKPNANQVAEAVGAILTSSPA
jgi:hypothetical protein